MGEGVVLGDGRRDRGQRGDPRRHRIGDGCVIQDNVVLGKQPKLVLALHQQGARRRWRRWSSAPAPRCAAARVVYAGTIDRPGRDRRRPRHRCASAARSARASVVGPRRRAWRTTCRSAPSPRSSRTPTSPPTRSSRTTSSSRPCVTTTNDNLHGAHRGAPRADQGRDHPARRARGRRRGDPAGHRDRRGGVRRRRAPWSRATCPPGKLVAGLPAHVWRDVPAEEMVDADGA